MVCQFYFFLQLHFSLKRDQAAQFACITGMKENSLAYDFTADLIFSRLTSRPSFVPQLEVLHYLNVNKFDLSMMYTRVPDLPVGSWL